MKPRIGIIICGFMENRQFVPDTYIHAIAASGGIPLLIPYIPASNLHQTYLSMFHGFLFCGGDDINPLLYGEEPLSDKSFTDLNLDSFHLEWMKIVLESALPVLGICRGMQVMNLALGGSLYQDVSLRESFTLNHMQHSRLRSDVSHSIRAKKESLLYNFLKDSTHVNSFHHQCIKELGTHLSVSAIAPDGIIEAIEYDSARFSLGVQWHPECMYEYSPEMRLLFSSFVNHCFETNM